MTISDQLWNACIEPGIDRATQEARAAAYIDHVLALDGAEQRAEILNLACVR